MSSRISTLAKAVRDNPEDSYYKFTLALEMLKLNQTSKALVLFEAIRESDPDYIGVYYHLAKLYEQLGENKKAYNVYKEGIKASDAKDDHHTKSELAGALFNLEIEMKNHS